MNVRTVLLTAAFVAAGGAIAWVYCLLLRYSVERMGKGKGKHKMSKFLGLMAMRVALVAGGFAVAVVFGGWPIVGNMAGFFVVRTLILTRSHIGDIAALEARRIKESGKQG